MDKPYRPTCYCKNINIVLRQEKDRDCFMSLVQKCQGRMRVKIDTVDQNPPLLLMEEETLWITDVSDVANALLAKKAPVLGWSHPGAKALDGVGYLMEDPGEIEIEYLERIYRRAAGIPWDILETERCYLRESAVEDVDSFYRIYEPESITRYMEGLFTDRELEEEYLRTYLMKCYRYFEFGVWTVIEKSSGEIIGRAGLSVRDGYDLPELGFVIGEPWQGRGIAYEICLAILQYGREEFDFHSFQALVQPGNQASIALCRKLGFAEQGRVTEQQQEYLLFVLG